MLSIEILVIVQCSTIIYFPMLFDQGTVRRLAPRGVSWGIVIFTSQILTAVLLKLGTSLPPVVQSFSSN